MKKIELHVHLDGSLNLEYINKLVGCNALSEVTANNSKNLSDYLDKFSLPIKLLQTKENLTIFSNLLVKDLKKDDCIYAEIRFCPLKHTSILSFEEVLDAVLEGLRKDDLLKTNLILCMMRNFSEEDNIKIIELAKEYFGKGVVGIDLAGDETKYPTALFKNLFDKCKEYNIPFTIHAGETSSFESIDEAMKFGAKRIGHGVMAINSMKTMNELKKDDITLEICVKSNLDTKVFNINNHPIKKLFDFGIPITINTDNRLISQTSLNYEYDLIKKHFNFTDEDFLKCNINAIDVAFISDDEKNILKKELLNK